MLAGVVEIEPPKAIAAALTVLDRRVDIDVELLNDLPHVTVVQILTRNVLIGDHWAYFATLPNGEAQYVPSRLASVERVRASGISVALADGGAEAEQTVSSADGSSESPTVAHGVRLECHVELRSAPPELKPRLSSGGTLRLSDLCRRRWKMFNRAQLAVEVYNNMRPATAVVLERLRKSQLGGGGTRWQFEAELEAGEHTHVLGGVGLGVTTIDGAKRCRVYIDDSGAVAVLTTGAVAHLDELCKGRWKWLRKPAAMVAKARIASSEHIAEGARRKRVARAHARAAATRGQAHDAQVDQFQQPRDQLAGEAGVDEEEEYADDTHLGAEHHAEEEDHLGEFFFHPELDEMED